MNEYSTLFFYRELLACRRCSARDDARCVVPGQGPLSAEIAVIGQNPTSEEDEVGIPFMGEQGEELDSWLTVLGLDRAKLLVTNSVRCHTERNRAPSMKEIDACSMWTENELMAYDKLRVIIPVGRTALTAVAGKMAALPPVISAWWMDVTFGERKLTLLPLPHPVYILRYPGKRPTLIEQVLPVVKNYMVKTVPDVYARAQRTSD